MPDETLDQLRRKLKELTGSTWKNRVDLADIDQWLNNFGNEGERDDVNLLYVLSSFMYFGEPEIRALLRSLYRQLYRTWLIENRIGFGKPPDETARELSTEISRTAFVSVGNPAESGTHLLYFFRQENQLPKSAFYSMADCITLELLDTGGVQTTAALPNVEHYVFIDDLCGSGRQARDLAQDKVLPLRRLAPQADFHFLCLFGTTRGLDLVRSTQGFDRAEALMSLDESFRLFKKRSRLFAELPYAAVDRIQAARAFWSAGTDLSARYPFGFENAQLALGFSHNVPNNSLPVFYKSGNTTQPWKALFARHNKIYRSTR